MTHVCIRILQSVMLKCFVDAYVMCILKLYIKLSMVLCEMHTNARPLHMTYQSKDYLFIWNKMLCTSYTSSQVTFLVSSGNGVLISEYTIKMMW